MKRSSKPKNNLSDSLLQRVRSTRGWPMALLAVVILAGLHAFRIDLSANPVVSWLVGDRILGNMLIVILLVGLWIGYLQLREPHLMEDGRMRLFLLTIVIAVAVLGKSVDLLAPYLVRPDQAAYLVPVAMGAGLATIFAGAEIGLTLAILLAFWAGLGDSINSVAVLAAFGSGTAAVFRCAHLRRLSDLPLAGLEIGLFGMLLHGGAGLVVQGLESFNPLMMVWSGLNGIISVLVMFGALPLAEIITQRTNPLGLVELLNPTSPLLLLLREQAPGTYHHSITVADLAESAARAVGADPLLTKVGGYYHDIGKMKRPHFFIENQPDGVNPHNEISPSMSKMILTSHIKEGIELAHEYGLREDITQFISQHHGTSVIRFFYQKALKEGKATEQSMSDYRYDAELPKTKETAIVMLADVVEAASHSVPDPAQLKETVRRAIRTPLEDDQLIESPLTLRDLEQIERAFFATLRAMRHDRSGSYPTQPESKKTNWKL
jgi:hypothetical protein